MKEVMHGGQQFADFKQRHIYITFPPLPPSGEYVHFAKNLKPYQGIKASCLFSMLLLHRNMIFMPESLSSAFFIHDISVKALYKATNHGGRPWYH